jgi:hypothetical protein
VSRTRLSRFSPYLLEQFAELLGRWGRNDLEHNHIAVAHDDELHSRLEAKTFADVFRNDDLPL